MFSQQAMESVMNKVAPRAATRRTQMNPQEFVGLCSSVLWGAAALYFLATFQPY